jgi:hypothetical protein
MARPKLNKNYTLKSFQEAYIMHFHKMNMLANLDLHELLKVQNLLFLHAHQNQLAGFMVSNLYKQFLVDGDTVAHTKFK